MKPKGYCVICNKPIYRRGKTCSVECFKAYQKAYRKTDKYKAYMKAYRKTDKYKAYRKAYMRTYHKTNKYKEYWKTYQKTDKYKTYMKAYREALKELIKLHKKEFETLRKKAIEMKTSETSYCPSYENEMTSYPL